jgi:hypothetical protein
MKNTCEARFLGRHIVCTRNRKSHVIPYREESMTFTEHAKFHFKQLKHYTTEGHNTI